MNVVAQARGGAKAPKEPPGQQSAVVKNFKSLAGAVIIYLFVKTLFVRSVPPFRRAAMIPTLLVRRLALFRETSWASPPIPFDELASARVHEPPTTILVRVRLAVPGDNALTSRRRS